MKFYWSTYADTLKGERGGEVYLLPIWNCERTCCTRIQQFTVYMHAQQLTVYMHAGYELEGYMYVISIHASLPSI